MKRQPAGQFAGSGRAHLVSLVTPLQERNFSGGIGCPLKGEPRPQDVLGRVDVRMGLVAARQAPEHGLAGAVPRSDVPARGAPLRGVTGVYLNDYSSGALSLGAQHIEEHPPTRIMDGLVQPGLGRRAVRLIRPVSGRARLRAAGHVRHLECLVGNHVVAADEGQRSLVRVIEARAANLAVEFGDPCTRLAPAVAATLLAGQGLLRCGQPLNGHRSAGEVVSEINDMAGRMAALFGRSPQAQNCRKCNRLVFEGEPGFVQRYLLVDIL